MKHKKKKTTMTSVRIPHVRIPHRNTLKAFQLQQIMFTEMQRLQSNRENRDMDLEFLISWGWLRNQWNKQEGRCYCLKRTALRVHPGKLHVKLLSKGVAVLVMRG